MVHKSIFVRRFKLANKFQRNAMESKLSSKTTKRPLLVLDVHGKPVFVNISLVPCGISELDSFNPLSRPLPEGSEYFFQLLLSLSKHQNVSEFMYSKNFYPTKRISDDTNFVSTANDCVLISIDFMNSTELLQSTGPFNTAIINKRFYDDIIHIIGHYYYPYIYLHEVIGDCFVLILNADWLYCLPEYCASLAINFVNRLHNRSKDYVSIRTGIGYGKITYGNIGNHLRFFGVPMNLTARMEGHAKLYGVVCDENFHEKLKSECQKLSSACKLQCTKVELELKGFGTNICYHIALDMDSEELVNF